MGPMTQGHQQKSSGRSLAPVVAHGTILDIKLNACYVCKWLIMSTGVHFVVR